MSEAHSFKVELRSATRPVNPASAVSCINAPCREIDRFCQAVDSCVQERQHNGASSAARALHERQRAYKDLQRGRPPRSVDSGTEETWPTAGSQLPQTSSTQLTGGEKSSSGRRSRHPAAGRVYSLDSALAAASSHSLHGSTRSEPSRTGADAHSLDRADAGTPGTVTNHVQESSSASGGDADAAPLRATGEHPEAALMAARRLVGQAIFGLEVCRTPGNASSGPFPCLPALL